MILAVQAIVWDTGRGRYVLRRFSRADADGAALAVHLGRAFITEVVLQAASEQHLRCLSRVDIAASELFAAPGSGGRTFERFLSASGRVEAIWFPPTQEPWLKTWTPARVKPAASRAVRGPYNYPFSDRVPEPVAELAGGLVAGHPEYGPDFARLQLQVVKAGRGAPGPARGAPGARQLPGQLPDGAALLRAGRRRDRASGACPGGQRAAPRPSRVGHGGLHQRPLPARHAGLARVLRRVRVLDAGDLRRDVGRPAPGVVEGLGVQRRRAADPQGHAGDHPRLGERRPRGGRRLVLGDAVPARPGPARRPVQRVPRRPVA